MAFKSYEEVVGPIELNLRGKTYTLPQPIGDDASELHRRVANQRTTLSDVAPALLGIALSELEKDGAPPALVQRVTMTALVDFVHGRDAAERAWNNPELLLADPSAAAKIADTTAEAPKKKPRARKARTSDVSADEKTGS
ncbi:hypothetical protein SPF06_02485 [Sinomonas sp. JGH33]|uniref:DUF7426 domain-containing protein n=1 Tax=Sinomonas terricola TaxID=3110330 RepID=A0ABU5T1Q7_9MICC|nr:hypothetical protein [Sinomonas sp. JGH33]MEA5453580.1 hypothetical protein [Sinomonas sp. JGH33]